MNKKVSTILTAGLMLCGTLFCSSAFAQSSPTPVDSDELNALYNGTGFNFKAESQLGDNIAVQGNLFEGTRIWAYDVTESTDSTVTTVADNGRTLSVPVGTYFFTDYVTNGNGIDWLNSTLIAVSPISVYESTDKDREIGEGFLLTEVKGNEFIYIGNTSHPEGDDISIYNACFNVEKTDTPTTDIYGYVYEYAVSLPNFYYQETATYGADDDQSYADDIKLDVVSFDNAVQYVVTQKESDNSYVFALANSGVLAGKYLLNDTKTPAVYTIKFLSGDNLTNKYLTVGRNEDNAFQWEAKGAAIADVTYPIFQYVITEVDASPNGTMVTFTNRETNENFKAQLFPQDADTTQFTFAFEGEQYVHPFTVSTSSANTYAVTEQDPTQWTNTIVAELTKVTPDEYAGFLNVDDKSMYTLSFARDVNDTSNKLYVGVSGDKDNGYKVNDNEEFATSNTSAAQWQLLKGASSTISRVYVYYNPSTESIDDVADGDKVTAYSYSLQYVEDGSETGYYLMDDIPAVSELSTSGSSFYIKENVDGSVSFFINYNDDSFKEMVLAPANKQASFGAYGLTGTDLNGNWLTTRPYIYESESEATDLKVYLDTDAADISWPAEEGYVTIKSDLGNYISMNEDRDGILINEDDEETCYLYVTDEDAITPSFYITRGTGDIDGERLFMFNPVDSVNYYVATGSYDRVYQWSASHTKVMFKPATINETRDTLTMTVKGETKYVTDDANDDNADIWGGIKRFKWQIVEADDAEGYYRIRQIDTDPLTEGNYLSAWNERLTWSEKEDALLFEISEVSAPTANESVTTSEVKIVAADGAVNIKNAAGKNVVISTILGQIVANETLTSDNATISVPSGIVIVSVEGEDAVKANVK